MKSFASRMIYQSPNGGYTSDRNFKTHSNISFLCPTLSNSNQLKTTKAFGAILKQEVIFLMLVVSQ
jgi:hypothetical protein